MQHDDEILTSREAQKLLKIGRTKLWALTRAGTLPAYRIGTGRTSGLRYKRSELLRWLEANRYRPGRDGSR
ncbi:MAG TPA: helix-turn-helix domain-containing protein [Candidatus Polarisedimenticolia bacterium]|nr:helix-turn-helix domain-containing protein [Candidatus Polarisedimenticolia bacterium]